MSLYPGSRLGKRLRRFIEAPACLGEGSLGGVKDEDWFQGCAACRWGGRCLVWVQGGCGLNC